MPLPFDATLKDLARDQPRAFLAAFDAPHAGPLRLLNVDLSTVTTAADLVVGLGEPLHEIVHLDFQSSAAAGKHADVLVYNALLHRQYRVPVHSIVLLLRPQATHPNLSGTVAYAARPGRGRMDFGYETIRLWERPVEPVLAGELGTLPLAPLCQLPEGVSLEEGLAGVVQRLVERLQQEAPPEQARRLLTASFVLTGMRITREVARELFKGVRAMRESDTYMAIIDEGRAEEAKRLILRQGHRRFGPASEAVQAAITALTDLDRLEYLHDRLVDVSNWQELLDLP